MQKSFNLILSIFFLFISVQLFAQKEKEKKRYEHFKERSISKTYAASGNTLNIDNSFGNVTVTTWDRNEIKVDIHIEASSTDKEHADKMFENIDVEEGKDGSQIRFKTTVNKNKDKNNNNNNYNCKNCNSTMHINYTIQMPAGNALKIENQFGSIQLPDYSGTVSLVSKFGSLTTGNLPKAEKLLVEFGSANIKSLHNVDATFKFSTIRIENLTGSNKIKMEFCNSSRINVSNDLTSLNLNESYSTVNIRPTSNFSASYSIHTSFGSVKDRSNANIQRTDKPDQYGPDSNKTYEGKSGSGSSKIEIKSSFGRIIIGEATEEEMKVKDKKSGQKI